MNELINEAKNGNSDAFKELIDGIKDILYRVAKSRLDSKDDIFDAIDNTVFKAYNNLVKLKKNEYFKTWIIRILINECNRIYRKNQRHNKIFKSLDENFYDEEGSTKQIDEIENKMDFESLIKILNEKEKIVFVLHFYANYDPNEISKLLKKSVNTIKSQLARGKEKIANYLKEKGGNIYDE